jgi:hypothetical protein
MTTAARIPRDGETVTARPAVRRFPGEVVTGELHMGRPSGGWWLGLRHPYVLTDDHTCRFILPGTIQIGTPQ